MNERQIKSLVDILKTTVTALEDEIGSNSFVDTHQFKVDYSDVLTYYAEDYDYTRTDDSWDQERKQLIL